MIINIRGTHGSGKSTVLRQFLDNYKSQVIQPEGVHKPEGYLCLTPFGDVYIVGSYKTACGGCDGIQPYALIWPRVLDYATRGHVLFEGALVSNSYGNIGRYSEMFGDQFVFAFLDTPLKTCIDRILERRKKNGNIKPFDPNKSVIRIYKSNKGVIHKCQNAQRRIVILDHRDPLPQVVALLSGA